VERTFDDSKNELGMSDYQVRKWTGWHHHHAIVFMAGLFLLNQKIDYGDKVPLMSMSDARILMVSNATCKFHGANIPGSLMESIVFPDPGGPIIISLLP
jgi:hypothetical protein